MTIKTFLTKTDHCLRHIFLCGVYFILSAPKKIYSLSHLPRLSSHIPAVSPPKPLLSPPFPSSLGLGHESEGAEDLTQLLLSLNSINFKVVHWDAIVCLISSRDTLTLWLMPEWDHQGGCCSLTDLRTNLIYWIGIIDTYFLVNIVAKV